MALAALKNFGTHISTLGRRSIKSMASKCARHLPQKSLIYGSRSREEGVLCDLWTTNGRPAWQVCPGLIRLAVEQRKWGTRSAENGFSRKLSLIFLRRIFQTLLNLADSGRVKR